MKLFSLKTCILVLIVFSCVGVGYVSARVVNPGAPITIGEGNLDLHKSVTGNRIGWWANPGDRYLTAPSKELTISYATNYVALPNDYNGYYGLYYNIDSAGKPGTLAFRVVRGCTLEVLKSPVKKYGIQVGYHTRIVYYASNAVAYHFEGYNSGISSDQCTITARKTGTLLKAHNGYFTPYISMRNLLLDSYTPLPLTYVGIPCSGIVSCLRSVEAAINQDGRIICYDILGPNSNSVVYAELINCGFDVPGGYSGIYGWRDI